MDHNSHGLRRSAQQQDAAGEAQANKARRLTSDSNVGPNGSSSLSNPSSPGAPSCTPASVTYGRGVPGEGSAGQDGLGSHPQQRQYQYHQTEEAAAMGLRLDGAHESQGLEVALDDSTDEQHAHGGGVRTGERGIGAGDGGAAGVDGGSGGDGGDPHQEAVPEGPMTDTIATGLIGMRQRRAVIEQQIDDLTNVALEFLEAAKKDFMERMTRLKSNVAMFCNGQEAEWRETNALTQEALGRLDAARSLVRSLGLDANSTGQPLQPGDALFGGNVEHGVGNDIDL